MLPAMFRCTSGATGLLATLRSTPSYRRVHVFGPAGSAEALGDTKLVIRRSGKSARRIAPGDSLRAELDAFAGARRLPDHQQRDARQPIEALEPGSGFVNVKPQAATELGRWWPGISTVLPRSRHGAAGHFMVG